MKDFVPFVLFLVFGFIVEIHAMPSSFCVAVKSQIGE
jgi:hypothetical protein